MRIPSLSKLFHRVGRESGCIAICLGRSGVHLVQVKRVGGRPQVKSCAFHPMNEITPAALEKISKKARLDGHHLITLLAPGEYQLLMVEAPNVPVNELKTAIRWRIKDMLTYHIDDATVDVLLIPTGKYGSERPQSLYAVAAANVTLQKRIAQFEKAHVELNVIDIPEMAQRNIAQLFEDAGVGLALLAIDEEGGLLTVTADGELYLARRIEITLGQLQDADEALRQQFLERVELEVLRSLDYFGRQYHYIPVKRLLISVHEGTGLERVLSDNLDVQVERLDLAQGLDISAVPELAHGDFAADSLHALGAALRQERRAL
jgi:MSHA biogenesis protein MshI